MPLPANKQGVTARPLFPPTSGPHPLKLAPLLVLQLGRAGGSTYVGVPFVQDQLGSRSWVLSTGQMNKGCLKGHWQPVAWATEHCATRQYIVAGL